MIINCPFSPWCKKTEENYEGIYRHIKEKHEVAGSVYYPDKYNGNGHNEILRIGND